MAASLDPAVVRLKVGKELFTRAGPKFVERLISIGFDVFLDLKFHDIPNTVAGAVRAAADLGVWMVNVHASGGRDMLLAARDAASGRSSGGPLLIAVTVLTSIEQTQLNEVGVTDSVPQQVLRLARLSRECGLDGVVCSPLEIAPIRAELSNDFCLVTPGIRPEGSAADDQKRLSTPAAARSAGADYLVIGRPITQADDPGQAVSSILRELQVGA